MSGRNDRNAFDAMLVNLVYNNTKYLLEFKDIAVFAC